MFSTYQPIAVETHPNNVQWVRLAKEKPEAFASVHYYHSTFDAINNATMVAFLKHLLPMNQFSYKFMDKVNAGQ